MACRSSTARFAGAGLACVGDEPVALVHVDDGRLVVERAFARGTIAALVALVAAIALGALTALTGGR